MRLAVHERYQNVGRIIQSNVENLESHHVLTFTFMAKNETLPLIRIECVCLKYYFLFHIHLILRLIFNACSRVY